MKLIKTFKSSVSVVQIISGISVLLFCPNNGQVWKANVKVVVMPEHEYIDIDSLIRYVKKRYDRKSMYQERLTGELFDVVSKAVYPYKAVAVVVDGYHYSASAEVGDVEPVKLRTFKIDVEDEKSYEMILRTIGCR